MADAEEVQNAPERLKEFEEQLASVEAMLLDDPSNEELLAIHAELTEVCSQSQHARCCCCMDLGRFHAAWRPRRCPCGLVRTTVAAHAPSHLPRQVIELTRELCEVQPQATEGVAAEEQQASTREQQGQAAGLGAAAAPPRISSLLPPQMAEQIRHAQQRAALAGQGPAEWAIGANVRAVYSGDGNWWALTMTSQGVSCLCML